MEVTAKLNHAPLSPQKGRLIADLVRNMKVAEALDVLKFTPKKGAKLMYKLLQSAIANAENNHNLDIDQLFISEATVGKAMVMKRFRPRARGRVGKILKPFSKIRIVVQEREETA